MKTKELIERLRAADPGGELECVTPVGDVFFCSVEPAYYDGPLETMVRDKSKAPFYDVVGAKIARSGTKVCIHTLSIEDAIMEDPDLPVDMTDVDRRQHEPRIAKFRAEARALKS